MTATTKAGYLTYRTIAYTCAFALLVCAALWWLSNSAAMGTKLSAYFDRTVGVYPGSAVRVIGIKVGKIDSVTPDGDRVRVNLTVDRGVQIPANAKALVVAPSLVSDRYVAFTPAYHGSGATMASGTVIPKDRTATPVELDQLYGNVNKLSTALGPKGANSQGALSDLLNTTAKNLHGNGKTINQTIGDLRTAADTLANSKGDFFETVDNLNKFTKTLAASDDTVHEFNDRMSNVTGFLANDREDLGSALHELGLAMTDVGGFVDQNKAKLSSNVKNLTGVTKALADQRGALAEILDVGPMAANNLLNSYDSASGSIAVRANFNELSYAPALMVCRLLKQATPKGVPPTVTNLCDKLAPVVNGALPLPSVAQIVSSLQQGKLPAMPAPLQQNAPGK